MLEASARRTTVALSLLAAFGAAVIAGVGVFSGSEEETFGFVSVRGEPVEIYGQGIYRHDSLMVGAGNVGVDLVILLLGVPLLVWFALLYRRGSVRGALLLSGALTFTLYVFAGRTLGTVAYNDLFLAYVAVFTLSFFALGLVLKDLVDQADFEITALPRRGIATVVLTLAAFTLILWAETPVTALISGTGPNGLEHYTTLYTHGVDLAVVVPLLAVSGVGILRRRKVAYLMVFPILFLVAMLTPTLTAMTISQVQAGVELSAGEIVAYVAGFVVLGVAAAWVLWRVTAITGVKG